LFAQAGKNGLLVLPTNSAADFWIEVHLISTVMQSHKIDLRE
jgi:hypothetical protein